MMMNRMNNRVFSLLGLSLSGLLLVSASAEAQPDPANTPDETGDFPTLEDPDAEAAEEEPAEPIADEPAPEEAVEPQPAPVEEVAPEPEAAPVAVEATVSISAEAPSSEGTTWNLSVAPRIGLAIPTSKLSPFVSMGVELGYRLPALDGHLVVVGDVAYTRPSHSASVNDARVGGDAGYEIDESELKLGIGAAYRLFDDSHKLSPWGGASLIMQRLQSTETNDLAPGENTSTDTRFGAEIAFGADYRLGPGYLVGEIRVPFTDLDDLITGNSNAGNVNLSVGYRLVF
jgi:hypothetical protein